MPKVSGYNFVKVGRSSKEMFDEPITRSSSEQLIYPSLHLDNQEIEGLEKYDVGDEVQLVIKGVVTRKSMSERKGGKKDCSQTIDIHTIGVPQGKSMVEKDDDNDEFEGSLSKVAKKKAKERMAY